MQVAKELWQKMLRKLEADIAAVNFDAWILPLEAVRIMDSKLVLCAANTPVRNFVTEKFLSQLTAAMAAMNPLMTDIVIIEPNEKEAFAAKEETFVIEEAPRPPSVPQNTINPKYNFENFVVGKSNELVYAVARAAAEEPGKSLHNPLFIYGESGLGKTHIMHAIGLAVRVSHPQLKVLYAPAEKFVNDFIESIRTAKGDSSKFREKYRNIDMLMIDDVQFIAGKDSSQEALFNTFNELHQANKQLVFTSDRPPKEIQTDERLRSRFEWGMMAAIRPPDLETRTAILQKKAQIEKYNIPLPVLSFMAGSMNGNVREMESLLNKVIFLSRLYEREPSVELVKEALKDYADKSEEAVTGERIIDCSCKYYAVNKSDLCGKSRNREISVPRQVCIYIMTERTAMPLAAIGELLGGRDHTTVMHARDKIAAQIPVDPKIKTAVNDITEMILRR